jgi:transposase
MRKAYQTDLTDAQWSCLESYLPAPKASGRPRIYPSREILDAIFYVLRSGCAWRLLPHDLERRGRRSTTTCASLAPGRDVGKDARRLAPARASPPEEEP